LSLALSLTLSQLTIIRVVAVVPALHTPFKSAAVHRLDAIGNGIPISQAQGAAGVYVAAPNTVTILPILVYWHC
jgi:hypothetical protein